MMIHYFIILPILIPILGGTLLLIHPIEDRKKRNIYIEIIVILNTLITFFLISQAPMERLVLLRFVGHMDFSLNLDGMACFFGGMVAFMWPFASLYAFEYMKHEERENSFFGFYTITYGVTMGVAFSGDIITMYTFYEALTLVTLPLVIHTMTREARKAARQYLYFMIGGTAFAFMGVTFITLNAETITFQHYGAFNQLIGVSPLIIQIMYLFMFVGFGIKAAIFPFQSWLPAASVAPTPVTALLHAVAVVKSGAFAVMRVTYFSFGLEYIKGTWVQNVVMILAMITIVYGSTMGVKESHFKRRLAYSTISNLSYILMATATMSHLGLVAALTHMLFHAMSKSSAFFCAGAVMHQSKKTFIHELDGMGYVMPITFAAFLVDGLSLTGIPLFAGFISKWNIAMSLIGDHSVLGMIGVGVLFYSALMTGIYMLTIIFRGFFPHVGYQKNALEGVHDPNWLMCLPIITFSSIVVYLGFHAQTVMDIVENIANGLI